jgi:hypothetical protein
MRPVSEDGDQNGVVRCMRIPGIGIIVKKGIAFSELRVQFIHGLGLVRGANYVDR